MNRISHPWKIHTSRATITRIGENNFSSGRLKTRSIKRLEMVMLGEKRYAYDSTNM